jgi:hypothetical protein
MYGAQLVAAILDVSFQRFSAFDFSACLNPISKFPEN